MVHKLAIVAVIGLTGSAVCMGAAAAIGGREFGKNFDGIDFSMFGDRPRCETVQGASATSRDMEWDGSDHVGLSVACLGCIVGGSFLLFNLLPFGWQGVIGNAPMQLLIGLGLISGAIGGGALLLMLMDIIAKLLIRYARLHFRLFDTANKSI